MQLCGFSSINFVIPRYRDDEGNDVTPLPLYVPAPEVKAKKKKKVKTTFSFARC
jgi:hypothetical protein